jgi:hypothetical protein
MAKPKKFDLENPAPVVDDEDEKPSPPLTNACGTLNPGEPSLQNKSDASYQSGLPPHRHAKSADDHPSLSLIAAS